MIYPRRYMIVAVLSLLPVGCAELTPQPAPPQCDLQPVLARVEQCLDAMEAQRELLTSQNERLAGLREEVVACRVQAEAPEQDAAGMPLCTPQDAVDELAKMIVGRREQVWLPDPGILLSARVDTGAETASIDAQTIERFERNSEDWVRFEILHPETGDPLAMERRVERTVLILQSNSPQAERRPVIRLALALGRMTQVAEFTLSDRQHLDHQMLIGRNILRDYMIVDVSRVNAAPVVRETSGADNGPAAQP